MAHVAADPLDARPAARPRVANVWRRTPFRSGVYTSYYDIVAGANLAWKEQEMQVDGAVAANDATSGG